MANFRVRTNTLDTFSAELAIREGELTRNVDQSGDWGYQVAATIMSNIVNDQAVVVVTGSHRNAPHGEAPNFTLFVPCLTVEIDADDFDEGTHQIDRQQVVRHEQHFDLWSLKVTFTVSSLLFADSITTLGAEIVAKHVTRAPKSKPVDDSWKPSPGFQKQAKAIQKKFKEFRKLQRSEEG